MTTHMLALLPAFLMVACAYESKAPPVSTTPFGRGPTSQMPQSPNSLPLGSAVAAPLDRGGLNVVTPSGPVP